MGCETFILQDELVAAHSLAFSCDGNKLYCGFNKLIKVFDTAKPGRQFQNRPTYGKYQESHYMYTDIGNCVLYV